MMRDKGILYIASNYHYYEKAKVSAKSSKNVMPNIPIAIVTNVNVESSIFDITIRPNMNDSFKDKVEFMSISPFDKTLYVDSDTYFAKPINDLWETLDYYDMAATLGVHRRYENFSQAKVPEYSTGVLLYNNSESVERLFDSWMKFYGDMGEEQRGSRGAVDQDSFRKAVFHQQCVENKLKFLTLPPEYQVIIGGGNRGFLRGPARILHFVGEAEKYDYEKIASEFNKYTDTFGWDKRVYYPTGWPYNRYVVKSTGAKSNTPHSILWNYLKENGPKRTISRIVKYLLSRF